MVEKDYTDIGAVTPMRRFAISLTKARSEFDLKHMPFDEQCARLDFRDKIEQAEKESERRHGFIKADEISLDFGDLKRYGDESRFEFIEEQPHMQDKVIEGTRTQVLTGYQRDFCCKQRGHGISVFIPAKDWKPFNKKREDKEE